jgi:LDH2 family malate/lactate/ureidoglycolate dehydrogenase
VITKTAEELSELTVKILLAAGSDRRNAEVVAEHLISADLSGVNTHGVWHLEGYVAAIKALEIVPTAWPEIVKETPTSALVKGNWTFGQVVAKYAMEVAIRKAKEQGVAVVGLVQAHHIGRLGHFVEMAAEEGVMSMVWAGGYSEEAPAAVPYGGRGRLLHTNPIAMGFPAGEEPRMMFDFATTALSGVKVVNAQNKGQQLPPDCIVDKEGHPTTDPNDFFSGGAHLPFGKHKGYALMMAAEFLGRIFSGSDAFVELGRAGSILRYQGATIIAIEADLFQPFADYARRADEMERRARAIPPAPGFNEVLVPGDPEIRTRVIRQRDGIPIAQDVWQSVVEVANSLGIKDL